MEKEQIKQVSFRIPQSLHRQMKFRAVEEDKSLTEMVISAMEDYLKKEPKEKRP